LDLQLILVKTVRRLRRVGLRATTREALARLKRVPPTDDFDVRYGTDTANPEALWKLSIPSPNARFGVKYQATGEQELLDAVNYVRENLRTFTFIDLGCGKARTLLIASHLGFKQLIGVEFAGELVEVARRNLTGMQIKNAVVVHADAADFCFPNGDLLLYLYNPFSQEVMRKVVANLRQSGPGKLYLVYKGPECASTLDSSGFLSRLGSPPARPYIKIWRTPTEMVETVQSGDSGASVKQPWRV
jgi:SAM-dependent methyltransferase